MVSLSTSRKIQRDEFSQQQSLPSGNGRSSSGRNNGCPDTSFSLSPREPCSTSAVDCSIGENFSIPDSYARLRIYEYLSLVDNRILLARNQLSATEAACRSSRTLKGICQALHASVPTIRARMSAPSNLRVAAARIRQTVRIECICTQHNEEGENMSSTDSDCCVNANASLCRAINKLTLLKYIQLVAN